MWPLVSRDSPVTRDTARVHVFLDIASYPYLYPLGTGTHWVRLPGMCMVAMSRNTCTRAISRVTGLVPRRTRKSGNEIITWHQRPYPQIGTWLRNMFTNIIRPPGSLPQAVPLVKQNIKLVWPYYVHFAITCASTIPYCSGVKLEYGAVHFSSQLRLMLPIV